MRMGAPPNEYLRCDGCGRLTRIDLIDGKDDGSGDFNILHCPNCYGAEYNPLSEEWAKLHHPPHYKEG